MAPRTRQHANKKEKKKVIDERKKARQREWARKKRAKINEDPEKHLEIKQKEHERYLRRKSQGKIKAVSDLSLRGQQAQRKKWREASKKHYLKTRSNNKPLLSKQVKIGRKRRVRASKASAEITRLSRKYDAIRKLAEKWEKKYQRATCITDLSNPEHRAKQIIGKSSVSEKIQKQLVLKEAIMLDLSNSSESCESK